MAKTRRKKKRTHVAEAQAPDKKPEPKTFVFRRGKHSALLGDLEQDLRRMLLPNTAINLRESKRNVLKDFVAVAGPLGVTHFVMLTATENASYLRIAKTPRGPTLTMRINEYALIRDVAASQARPRMPTTAFKTPPLLVMNGFGNAEHLRLTTAMWQHMLPSINVQTVKLSSCQRVLLLSHDAEKGTVSLRHYSISVSPSGIKKSLKALLQRKDLPDLGAMQDVAEFVTKSGYGSESEGEDAEASRVDLAQEMGRGNTTQRQSRIRLHEIGPRLEMQIVKTEEGLCDGAVLYHAHVQKSAEEAGQQQQEVDEKEALRAQRRRQQEENVRRKEAEAKRKAALEEHNRAIKEGRPPPAKKARLQEQQEQQEEQPRGKQRQGQQERQQRHGKVDEFGGSDDADDDMYAGGVGEESEQEEADDDVEYYRQEVGQEPDEDEKVGITSWGRGSGGRGGRGRGGRSSSRGRGGRSSSRDGGGGRGGRGGRSSSRDGGGGRGGRGGRSTGRDGGGGRGGRGGRGGSSGRGGRGGRGSSGSSRGRGSSRGGGGGRGGFGGRGGGVQKRRQ